MTIIRPRVRPAVRAVVALFLGLAPAVAACAPAAPVPAGPEPAAGPVLPPAVFDDPDWVLLVRPAALRDESVFAALLGGLDLAGAFDAFLADHGLDAAALGWVRVESAGGATVFVVAAAAASGFARALGSVGEGSRPVPAAESPVAARPSWSVATDGAWGVVRRETAGVPASPRSGDPAGADLARLRRRVEAAEVVFLRRRPPSVRAELDPTGLLAETRAVGCVAAGESAEALRLGCVLFGPAGDRLSTQSLRRLQTTVFDSTLGTILNLEGAAREVRFDPEPGAGYLEAVLDVAKLLPGLRVLAAVPLAHILESAAPPAGP